MKGVWLIARTVLVEAVRRREIYALVLIASGVILLAGYSRFFSMEGLDKFYRETALQVMNITTGLAVIILAARQLPREFENRTIYPLLAKPVGRGGFLLGKFLGVLLAGAFCYGLFLLLYLLGLIYISAPFTWSLLLQGVYLQLWAFAVLASLAFLLSLLFNVDAAITLSVLLYVLGQTYTQALDFVYEIVPRIAQYALLVVNFLVPQFTLFDLTGKVVHANVWDPLPLWVMGSLTAYGASFLVVFLLISYLLFRRRPL